MKSLDDGILLKDPITMLLGELEDETFNTVYTLWAVNTNSANLDPSNLSNTEAAELMKILNELSEKYGIHKDTVYVKFILKNQRFGKRFRNYFIQEYKIDLLLERLVILLDGDYFQLVFQNKFGLNPLLYTKENILSLLEEIAANLSLEIEFVVSTFLELNPQDQHLFTDYLYFEKRK